MENRKTRLEWVKNVSAVIDIPWAMCGGISTLEDIEMVLNAGGDKISVKPPRRHVLTEMALVPPAVYINGKADSACLTSIDKSGARPGVLPNMYGNSSTGTEDYL